MTRLAPGVWGILATPFAEDLSFDADSMRRQLQLHQAAGSTGLVALGVFGEAARLNLDEQIEVVQLVAAECPEMPLVFGLSERDTGPAIELATALLRAVPDRDVALMCQIPGTDPAALITHFNAIYDATGKDIVVQDYPVVSGITVTSETILRLLDGFDHAAAIKSESPPTSVAIAELASGTDVPIFGGLGALGLLDELMAGASGAMTGFSHPEGLVAAIRGWQAGGYTGAREAFQPWLPLVNFEAQAGIGLSIRKTALAMRGMFTTGRVRPPAPVMPNSLIPLLESHINALVERRVA